MMISICSPVFDVDGCIAVEPTNTDGMADFTRRVTRIATLDGGASFNDFGYSDSDRLLIIEWTPLNDEQSQNAARMVKSYGRLIISNSEGCFVGAPESFSKNEETVLINILVERRIDL